MSPQRLFALILGPVILSAAVTPGFAGDLVEIPLAQPGAPELGLELRKQLAQRYSELGPDYRPRTRNLREDGSPLYTNRLLLEASPYLQQHAHNPVNWYPWGDEAFAAAKRLGRPVLVSIGYSTCHWCHVMEEESFDDPETAKHLNERFIAIKVDREARPDVDDVYMAAVHAMGIRGGWPLNVFVTPDRRPFYGGTYFPPRGRGGRPGFREILTMISEQYAENPSRTSEQADRVTAAVVQRLEGASAIESRIPNADSIAKAARVHERNADRQWGGTGTQPKFPSSLPTRLLLRYERRTGDREALAIATLSLEKMAEGGIRDHIGGGFHRYSTDQRWLVPHFEKMLYDNALLAQDYLEAWQRLGRADFAAMTREILDYVAMEMTAPEGGFYSATDADSLAPDGEMEEGWFFTWTPAEIRQALTPERAKELELYYRVSSRGDYEGRNIFHTRESLESVAATLGIEPEVLRRNLDTSRASLYQVRSQREPPLRDEKILVAWNGLMISAFARAGFAFDEPRYVESARRAADFILTRMRDDDGRLIRVFKDGRAAGPSFLDDHAFFIKALLDLYEADPGPRWLAEAIALQRLLDEHYRDDAGGGYFASADDGEMLIVREKPGRDGAVPSGNSIEALNLLRLYEFTTDMQYAQSAELLFSAFHEDLSAGGAGLSEMLIALDFQLDTPKEIVIVAPASGEGLAEMLAPLRRTFLPNRIVSVATEGKDLDAQARYAPLLKNKPARRGRTTAYVCEDRVCALPTESPEEFEKQISQLSRYAGKPSGGNGAGR